MKWQRQLIECSIFSVLLLLRRLNDCELLPMNRTAADVFLAGRYWVGNAGSLALILIRLEKVEDRLICPVAWTSRPNLTSCILCDEKGTGEVVLSSDWVTESPFYLLMIVLAHCFCASLRTSRSGLR